MIVFQFATRSIEALVRGVQALELNRDEPWGPSSLANSAVTQRVGEEVVLSIEMQRGDEIKIVGGGITWAAEPSAGTHDQCLVVRRRLTSRLKSAVQRIIPRACCSKCARTR